MTTGLVEKSPSLVVYQEEPLNAGVPAAEAAGEVTPTERFFVRNHGPVPAVDAAAYRLRVDGLARRPLELSLADLAGSFERVTVPAALQCAGFRRQELFAVTPIPGELPWGEEPAGNATWSGFRLADVLAAAGPEAGAAHVAFTGLDSCSSSSGETPFGGSVPLDKATSPEVLLADGMNGGPLPAVHGGPLRVVVPGYIGARSVKWVERIELRATPSENHYQSRAYRWLPQAETAVETAEMLGELWVTSLLVAPAAGAVLSAGPCEVSGWALAADGVARVEVSADGGSTWQAAELAPEASPWAWRLWRARVDLAPGGATLVARAFDAAGHSQPADPAVRWNRKGYMNNAWHRVPVEVAG
ncbi:MAG TPA: sulfite oxidase [Thermoanaerobaculia bacterium]|nr:sulfite oxidase [Thermoanaerobaculia bacterium]